MRRFLKKANAGLELLGPDLRKTRVSAKAYPGYRRDLSELRGQEGSAATVFPLGDSRPCLGEDVADSGQAKGHYFHQDLLVARRIFERNPHIHVDVGSRVDGFVAHVASFRPIEVFDIRPLPAGIANIDSTQLDLMAPLPEELKDYCDSLSCLHALEHFGLGRYGDPVDYDGYLVGLENLGKILRSGGVFYLSVPIGPQRIEFNAHRVFSIDYLLGVLQDSYRIERFSFVDDDGELHEDVLLGSERQTNFGCNYGCGIFEMAKL